jgi:hypothetical protein
LIVMVATAPSTSYSTVSDIAASPSVRTPDAVWLAARI